MTLPQCQPGEREVKVSSFTETHGGLTWYSVDRSQGPEYADSADGGQAGIMAVQRILHHPEDRVKKMSEGRQRAELKEPQNAVQSRRSDWMQVEAVFFFHA